jgi:hypothetical protein
MSISFRIYLENHPGGWRKIEEKERRFHEATLDGNSDLGW